MKTLKFIREQQGLSLRSLVRLEAGRYDPRLSTLRKIAKALEVSVCDLLTDQQSTQEGRK
jgi:transcriptional regulator with XRE-family HTH domain